MHGGNSKPSTIGTRGAFGLALGCATIVVVWLVVLPAVGRQNAVRRYIERNRARGIHPDAMFYTEIGPVDGVRLVEIDGRPAGEPIRMGE